MDLPLTPKRLKLRSNPICPDLYFSVSLGWLVCTCSRKTT